MRNDENYSAESDAEAWKELEPKLDRGRRLAIQLAMHLEITGAAECAIPVGYE